MSNDPWWSFYVAACRYLGATHAGLGASALAVLLNAHAGGDGTPTPHHLGSCLGVLVFGLTLRVTRRTEGLTDAWAVFGTAYVAPVTVVGAVFVAAGLPSSWDEASSWLSAFVGEVSGRSRWWMASVALGLSCFHARAAQRRRALPPSLYAK